MEEVKYTYYINRKTKIISFGILLTGMRIQQWILDHPLTKSLTKLIMNPWKGFIVTGITAHFLKSYFLDRRIADLPFKTCFFFEVWKYKLF